MLCPPFFLVKISKVKIRNANPLFSANAKRFDLAVTFNLANMEVAFANAKEYSILGKKLLHLLHSPTGKICLQSFFISTIIQPSAAA